MKSHLVLLRMLLAEAGDRCCTSTIRDFETITERVKDEGLEFLTITLPQFSKDLERSLDIGKIDSTLFQGFRRRACLPAFLQGFTSRIFDASSGVLLDTPCIDSIQSIRQICNLMGKLELPCSDARERAAFTQYIETDKQVEDLANSHSRQLVEEFEQVSLRLWGDILAEIDKSIFDGGIVPKHGPGATADRICGNAKFSQQVWTQRLEELFPHGEFTFPNWRHFDAERVSLLAPEAETPVRVISVPKTQKTPRIIAIEPLCIQYVQQGLMERIVSAIESHDKLSVVVGFADQERNQFLAKQGSKNGSLATLDLSEASDRVSWKLVQSMCRHFPWVTKALDATRSRQADVPGYGIHTISKYASMGSALCFPIEAMVFTTIIFLAIERATGTPVCGNKRFNAYYRRVRVYGDDIIVPTDIVDTVVECLEAFGLKVNSNKSFWTGKFRESCGKEYYDGEDVTYVKLRRLFPTQRQQAPEIVSLVSFRNQLYKAGWWKTCEWLDSYIGRLIPFPVVEETSQVLGRHSFLGHESQRTCRYLQRPLVKGAVVSTVLPPSKLEGPDALLKFFLKRGSEPLSKDHLRRAGRPDAVNIKLGWYCAY